MGKRITYLLLLTVCLTISNCFGQDTIYINNNIHHGVSKEGKWKYYLVAKKGFDKEGDYCVVKKYTPTNILVFEIEYLDSRMTIKNGRYQLFYPNGETKVDGNYKMGKRIYTWEFFDSDGKLKYERDYKVNRK